MTRTQYYLLLHGSVILLVVSMWFPGATRMGGSDGSISFLLAMFCAALGVACYGQIIRGLHRTEAALALAILMTSGVIMVLAILSMVYANDPLRTLRVFFALLFGFALIPALAAISIQPKGAIRLDTFVSVTIAMAAITSALVIAGLGEAKFADRAAGYFKHANQLGIALSAVLPLVAARLISSRKHRFILLICTVAIIIGMMKSGSKTNLVVGVLGLGLLIALYCAYLAVRRQRPISILLAVAAVPVLFQSGLIALQALNPRAYRLLAVQVSGGDAHSMISREQLWSLSLDLGLAHPFTGVGAGQPLGDIAPHSHNLFIEYFRTLGVPGVALITALVITVMIGLIGAIVHTVFRSRVTAQAVRADIMVLGSAVSVWSYILANQMSDSFGPSTAPFFWLPLALFIAYRGLQRSGQYSCKVNVRARTAAV